MRTTMREALAGVDMVGKAKSIANNTFRYQRPDGTTVVRLHRTDVIEKTPDGKFKLDTGGWRTPTTKERFNLFTPYRVYANRGIWHVNGDGKSVPYFDGIVLPDALSSNESAAKAEEEIALRKRIKVFVDKTLASGTTVPKPHNGDCWYCLMFDREEANGPSGTSGWVGKVVDRSDKRNSEHLLSHIEEGYMNGSLIVNAFRAAGYRDEGISYFCFGPDPNLSRIRSVVRRYLNRRLGLSA